MGGSVAQGTAIPGHFDLDISILSPSKSQYLENKLTIYCIIGLHPKRTESRNMESLYKRGLEQIMECLQTSLTNHHKISNVQELYGNHGRRFKSWHFQVDLSLSVKWDSLDDMCTYLKPLPQQERKL